MGLKCCKMVCTDLLLSIEGLRLVERAVVVRTEGLSDHPYPTSFLSCISMSQLLASLHYMSLLLDYRY